VNQRIFGLWGRRISPTGRGSLFYLGISSASAIFLPFITVFYADRGLSGREIGLLTAVGPVIALLLTNRARRVEPALPGLPA